MERRCRLGRRGGGHIGRKDEGDDGSEGGDWVTW